MKQDFINVAIENIHLILNSKLESIHKNEFKYNENIDLDELILFLINKDYIETEKDDDIYFLTHDTYNLIDSGGLEVSFLSDSLLDNHKETEIIEIESINETTKESLTEKLLIKLILLVILSLISWYIYNNKPKNNFKNLKIEINKSLLDNTDLHHNKIN